MRVQHFGRKSLDEIIASVCKGKPVARPIYSRMDSRGSGQAVTSVVKYPTCTNLSPSQCAFLAKRLDEVDLSVRTSNCLNTLKIKYLGELVQYSPGELMRLYAFGKKSLEELTALFAAVNLPLGLHMPELDT